MTESSRIVAARKQQRNNQILKLLAQGAKGAAIIAKDMVQPLREYQDYVSVGRNALQVETLAQGQDPLIDYDVDGNLAYVISNLSADVSKIINPETVRINTFDIASNPTIRYEALQSRKYDLKDRVQQKAEAEIFRVEDRMIFNALLAAATHKYSRPIYENPAHNMGGGKQANPVYVGDKEVTIAGDPINKPVVSTFSTVSIREISTAMGLIEAHGGLQATNLFINPYNAQILRNINVNSSQGYFVDFDTSSELMQRGIIGKVYGLTVQMSPEIPKDKILITAQPSLVGRIIERIPLSVIPYEIPAQLSTAFSIFENVGVLVHNPKSVAAITLS